MYEAMRDSCIKRKRQKQGKVSEKDIKDCKRMAAITYYKKTGKPVSHANADLAIQDELPDELDTQILIEQLDLFGSLLEWEKWNEGGDDEELPG